MRDQLNPPAHKPSNAGFPAAMQLLQRFNSQVENLRWVHLACEQAFFRSVETDGVAEVGFRDLAISGTIEEETIAFRDGGYGKRLFVTAFDGVADAKANASQRGVVACVFTLLIAGAERGCDAAVRDLDDAAQPQLRFTVADPTLARVKFVLQFPLDQHEMHLWLFFAPSISSNVIVDWYGWTR